MEPRRVDLPDRERVDAPRADGLEADPPDDEPRDDLDDPPELQSPPPKLPPVRWAWVGSAARSIITQRRPARAHAPAIRIVAA
ncbi:MAG: hypothetical protein KC619_05440 [Myxococcales bacterium]|nr:hypothetical protein [Myxococcales bacterium]